ncbi:MAG: hypothetical protein N2257_08755 [Thermodesulfovibrionales bacterium]|nr:hypothetical protein [Thermodesulfovibrionales bacterium]
MEEIALCQDEVTRRAHKELFGLPDGSYIISEDIRKKLFEINLTEGIKVHLCLNWSGLLKIILWTDDPPKGFVKNILLRAGVEEKELNELDNSDILNIFYWLYYGNRFKVLRKLCLMAKELAEDKVKSIRFECHLIAEEISKIVASTL